MSYLVIKSASNATPESYQLTSTIDKPRLVVSGSYIPLTTNSGGGNLKVANGNTTYHVMKTSTSSYSRSASASATYLTTADSPNGLSNITNLTRSSTVNALTRSSTSSVYTTSSSYERGTTQPYPSGQTMLDGYYELKAITESSNGSRTSYEIDNTRIKSFIATSVSIQESDGDTLSQFYPVLNNNSRVTLTINDTRESARATGVYIYSVSPGFVFRKEGPGARYTYETHVLGNMESFTSYETTTSLTRESIYSYGTCSSISGYSTQESISGYSGVSSSSSSSSKSASSTCWR